MAVEGYVHGSDMLVGLMMEDAFSPLGHSKTCTISNKAETKERAVKPTLADKVERKIGERPVGRNQFRGF